MSVIVIRDIQWDTEGDSVDLPKEVYITEDHIAKTEGVELGASKEELFDYAADILSDNFGWCVAGFSCETVDIDECELGEQEAVVL